MIKTDPKLVEVLEAIKKRPRIPYSQYIRTVMELHTKLPDVRPRGAEMARARLRISTDRSQIVGIKLVCLKEIAEVRRVETRMRDFLYAKYATYLAQHRNKRARDAIVSDALSPLTKRIQPIADVLQIIDTALADFDSKGYAIRDSADSMRLAEREIQ
jgi:23S rRNA U2552 (ribose-2'-O)-methylase RlmE/FtsJ